MGSCSLDIQSPKQEDRDGEQKETPTIQGETVSDLLNNRDTQKSIGPDGIYPRVLKEVADMFAKTLPIIDRWS